MVHALASIILLGITVVAKDEKSPAVQSLRTLWGDRLRVNPEPGKDDVVLVWTAIRNRGSTRARRSSSIFPSSRPRSAARSRP
jgi:hypothetical protein